MDSKDETQDSLVRDFYYTDEDENSGSDSDNHESDDEFPDESTSLKSRQGQYIALSENDIQLRQKDTISLTMNIMEVSRIEAGILLRFFNWSISELSEKWFADQERVRESVGLVQLRPHQTESRSLPTELQCRVCFDTHSLQGMKASPKCGHFFCDTCWMGYIHTAINDGPGCLTLRCADPSCRAAIREDMVLSLVSKRDGAMYTKYLQRSFVENNRAVKWCPAPGCHYAVEYSAPMDYSTMDNTPGSFNILCNCLHYFCWNCLEEAHSPVDCETVKKWILKNSADSENVKWMLVNTKPCPKCKRPIEKNQGCMHMICSEPCNFHFCWLCLGAWTIHGEDTGGFYKCNRYEKAKEEGVYDEGQKMREMAKTSLEQYTHYYERWASNESSRTKAISNLHQMQATDQIAKLSDEQWLSVSELKFLTDAWSQIVECRRVLKWTYTYGYYLLENDHIKRQFFEYLQGEAEVNLERLHHCAEMDLQVFVDGDKKNNFREFRIKLATLTIATGIYFKNLVRALENGLADVDSSQKG